MRCGSPSVLRVYLRRESLDLCRCLDCHREWEQEAMDPLEQLPLR